MEQVRKGQDGAGHMTIVENKVSIGKWGYVDAYVKLIRLYDADDIIQEMLNAPDVLEEGC